MRLYAAHTQLQPVEIRVIPVALAVSATSARSKRMLQLLRLLTASCNCCSNANQLLRLQQLVATAVCKCMCY